MQQEDVILKPVITEKSMHDAGMGKFTFAVMKTAHKGTIKKAVEKKFNVHVVSLTTSIVKGGRKRTGKRMTEKVLSSWKKATVKLKKDEKIALFDVGGKTS